MSQSSMNNMSNRAAISVLIIHTKTAIQVQIRQTLKSLGFNIITSCNSHLAGLDRIQSRTFHVVFLEARTTDMPVIEFLDKALEMDASSALVAITSEPRIDDVFGFLQRGGRGFLVTPFTSDSLEEALSAAKEGPPISEAVLTSPDRNSAFAAVILNNLYRLAVLMRQMREFPALERELARSYKQFCESCHMGKMFCEFSEDALRDKIIEACVQRANIASTRLGRMRKKLSKKRTHGDGTPIEDSDEEQQLG